MQQKYTFEERTGWEDIKRSATLLVKLILQDKSGITQKHQKEVLDTAIWKLTEAESKKKTRTRYCSIEAFNSPDLKLEHEHVFQKKAMIRKLLTCHLDEVEEILGNAVACTVTPDQHRLLNKYKSPDGWERYRVAGITVVDAKETQLRGEVVVILGERQ